LICLGTYPDVSLKLARGRRDAVRRQVAERGDPSALRLAGKVERHNCLRQVAEQWFEQLRQTSHAGTIARVLNSICVNAAAITCLAVLLEQNDEWHLQRR
jgi:hypothetical protein